MKHSRASLMAVVLAGVVACGGCGFFDYLGGTGRGGVPTRGRRIVVLPFATPQRSYFESRLGARFSEDVAEVLRAALPSATVVAARDLPAEVGGLPLERMTLAQLAETLGADYLVIGEIHALRGKEPKSFRVLKGTMVLTARLYSAAKGRVVKEMPKRTFHYPPLLGGEPIPAQETDEEVVVRKVMKEGARGVAELLTGPRATGTPHFLE